MLYLKFVQRQALHVEIPRFCQNNKIEIKLQSIKGQTINHKMKLTHCRYLSQRTHAHVHTHTHNLRFLLLGDFTCPNDSKRFQLCVVQILQIVHDLA